jgi:hypothetical protein
MSRVAPNAMALVFAVTIRASRTTGSSRWWSVCDGELCVKSATIGIVRNASATSAARPSTTVKGRRRRTPVSA